MERRLNAVLEGLPKRGFQCLRLLPAALNATFKGLKVFPYLVCFGKRRALCHCVDAIVLLDQSMGTCLGEKE